MIKHMVDFLNAALKQRTTSMHHVFLTVAVKATQEMIDHPTIQVAKDDYVRMIGMLNGCVSEGNKRIMMVMNDEKDQILKFEIGEFVDDKLVQNKNKKITLFCNDYGQIQCHKCGYYSDIVYSIQLRNENGSWTSHLCGHCVDGHPNTYVIGVGKQIDRKTYDGPVKKG